MLAIKTFDLKSLDKICKKAHSHVRVHLTGECLHQLGDELVAEVLALGRHQLDGDQVTGPVEHLLQLLLWVSHTKISILYKKCH